MCGRGPTHQHLLKARNCPARQCVLMYPDQCSHWGYSLNTVLNNSAVALYICMCLTVYKTDKCAVISGMRRTTLLPEVMYLQSRSGSGRCGVQTQISLIQSCMHEANQAGRKPHHCPMGGLCNCRETLMAAVAAWGLLVHSTTRASQIQSTLLLLLIPSAGYQNFCLKYFFRFKQN